MEPDLSFIGTDIDLNDVAALHRSRLIVFVNAFLQKSVQFLNVFSQLAEDQILSAERNLDAIETKLQILEAKLKRFPKSTEEENGITNQRLEEKTINRDEQSPPQAGTSQEISIQKEEVITVQEKASPALGVSSQYEKYFKMMKMGVPRGAVEQKMIGDGLDPAMLDASHSTQESVGHVKQVESDIGDSDSASSFSDSE